MPPLGQLPAGDLQQPQAADPEEATEEAEPAQLKNRFEVLEESIAMQKREQSADISDFQFKINQVHTESSNVQENVRMTDAKLQILAEWVGKIQENMDGFDGNSNAKFNSIIEAVKDNYHISNKNHDQC